MIDADALVRLFAIVASICFAAALMFAFLYGTVEPRLRRVVRKWARDREKWARDRESLADARRRIKALESMCAEFEAELLRVDAIRKKTEQGLMDFRKLHEGAA